MASRSIDCPRCDGGMEPGYTVDVGYGRTAVPNWVAGELGMAVLRRVQEQTAEMAKVEAHPRMEGRQMLMVLAPK